MKRWYTPEEIQFVRKNIRGCSYIEITRLFNERFGLQITLKQMENLVYKHKLHNGLGTINGYAPPNKGKKCRYHGGNYKPIGSERDMPYSTGEVYVEVKTGHRTWKRKHVVIWEEANGKIPKGYVVIFADGNTRNFDLDNLMLMSKAELVVMNRCGLIFAHKELTQSGKIIADIKLLIAERKRGKKKGRKRV
jgi:hypothetical protein